jgi:hypothetical protein
LGVPWLGGSRRVGLYFRGGRLRFACHPPPKTKPRYAGLVPKGVTIPNANAEKDGSIGIAPRIFEKKTANPKPVSREDILATQDVYDKIISIENFPFNDINLFKST